MKVTLEDRILAATWCVVAICVGPLAVVGFFHGGFLILAALWAIHANLDVTNPFQRSRPRQPEPTPQA
jgi:hypothetical protein